MIIPVGEELAHEVEGVNGKSEDVNVPVEGVKAVVEGALPNSRSDTQKNLVTTLFQIHTNPGFKIIDMAKNTGTPAKSVERYIKQLREAELVEFRGASKTGGYFTTENFNKRLEAIIIKGSDSK